MNDTHQDFDPKVHAETTVAADLVFHRYPLPEPSEEHIDKAVLVMGYVETGIDDDERERVPWARVYICCGRDKTAIEIKEAELASRTYRSRRFHWWATTYSDGETAVERAATTPGFFHALWAWYPNAVADELDLDVEDS
jgi:hypothetical protein